jgi:hypothetical protein
VDWVAYDSLEPIGPRVVPDLLAVLTSIVYNANRKPKSRAWLPQDIFPAPMQPPRLSPQEEARRVGAIAADYRRLRKERLARLAEEQKEART